MADSTIPRPGDTDNALLRKILTATNAGGGGGGGGGGAVTIANGADVALGSVSDAAVTNPASNASLISVLKGILTEEIFVKANTFSTATATASTIVSIGDVSSVAVTNPASNASVIAVLKGILTAVNVPAVGGTSSTTLNTSLTTINSSIATTNSSLTTISGKIDTLNTTVAGTGQQRGAITNRSGSITSGATSQQVAAINATRKYFFFQNISTETMWINFTTAAVADQPSIQVLQGGSFVMETFFVSTEAINVISATTGSKFVAKEA